MRVCSMRAKAPASRWPKAGWQYVFLARGKAVVNGHAISAGDALLYAEESLVEVEQGTGAEMLVFDLPRVP